MFGLQVMCEGKALKMIFERKKTSKNIEMLRSAMPFLSFLSFFERSNRNIRYMYDESPQFIDTI
jgi:hypothetical protein